MWKKKDKAVGIDTIVVGKSCASHIHHTQRNEKPRYESNQKYYLYLYK